MLGAARTTAAAAGAASRGRWPPTALTAEPSPVGLRRRRGARGRVASASVGAYTAGMAVPWNQIVRWAPQILAVSRDLLQRTRRDAEPVQPVHPGDDSGLARRVAALEENERRQAELVDRMAAQQAELGQAVVALHRQVRVLTALSVALGLLALAAVFLAARGA